MPADRHVVFVLFDGVKTLDVAGPAEVFADATRFGARYRLGYVSASGRSVRSSVGIDLPVDGSPTADLAPDTLVVAGGDVLAEAPVPPRR